jgi:hypothetical protein
MAEQIAPEILQYLANLSSADRQIANTWRPDDREYLADLHRQTMMSLSYGYFAYFHADAEHPDWAPLWNPVYTLQPNPDDIYLYSPIRGDLAYRVSGDRGTVKLLSFTTMRGMAGMVDGSSDMGFHNDIDDRDLVIGQNGQFELILSVERPAGYTGNWCKIAPEATSLTVRYRSYDWENERDPRLSIECLNKVPPKPRLTPEQIVERIREMAKMPGRCTGTFFRLQNAVRETAGVNVFQPVRYAGGLSKQVYWPAVFEFEDGEALIIETELPKVALYWNIQLNDPYFNAVEYVYRLSSLNGHTAKISSDGKIRAVVALEDPGVPNWLDTAGFRQGTIYGRWFDCSDEPMPTLKRVPLSELRRHLPDDTPVVTPDERAAELARRVRAAQRRRRW